MRKLSGSIAIIASLAAAGACVEDDRLAELEEFRKQISNNALSRVVIARMYQRGKWMIREVDGKPNAEKIDYVCKALAELTPTYVSGLVRLDYIKDMDEPDIDADMLEIYDGVKKCVRKAVKEKNGGKVRFDVVLNALHYTSEEDGVTSVDDGFTRLTERISSANALDPDGYFFDFYSIPHVEELKHRYALAKGIDHIRGQDRFVGGNIFGGFIPDGSDFVAITDRGLLPHVEEQMGRIKNGADKPPVPVLMHIRNDPHCRVSEGRKYVERDTKYRKQQLRRHVQWQELGFTYMYPVFFPLYKPGTKVDDCDKKNQVEEKKEDDNDGYAFDASLDGLLPTMRGYLGPPPKQGDEAHQRPAVSTADALPTPYDLADNGLIPVHRAVHAANQQHLYSRSLLEVDEGAGLDTEYEDYFSLGRDQGPGSAPLYRCYYGSGWHILTVDPNCEGASSNEGVLGYAGMAALDGTVPLFRLSHAEPFDHMFTTSATERDAAVASGYLYEGIAAYVWDESGNAVGDPPPVDPPDDPPPPDALPCDAPLQPVYKGYQVKRQQHLFTSNHDELLVPNMNDEGVAFQLKPTQPSSEWVPFYRCYFGSGWHVLTVDATCEGIATGINEGSLGNISTTPQTGTVPLHRYFHAGEAGKNDHFYVTGDACQEIAGYTCEGAVGHVCP